ncbi:hypothetical protein M758_1G163100 [Ceratodon purpureus]|nr:hypothetical protein M758_1G163100 [Ceratodon purpureus]
MHRMSMIKSDEWLLWMWLASLGVPSTTGAMIRARLDVPNEQIMELFDEDLVTLSLAKWKHAEMMPDVI